MEDPKNSHESRNAERKLRYAVLTSAATGARVWPAEGQLADSFSDADPRNVYDICAEMIERGIFERLGSQYEMCLCYRDEFLPDGSRSVAA